MVIPGLIPPTAKLSDSEINDRLERIHFAERNGVPLVDERQIKAKAIGLSRDPRIEFDNRDRQPAYTSFAKEWTKYMQREQE